MLALGIAVLILLGVALIVTEFFILPGTFVPGIIGFLLMCFGIVLSYRAFGAGIGHTFLFSSMGVFLVVMFFALRSKTWQRLTLTNEPDDKASVIETAMINVGDRGIALSQIGPTGKANLNGQIVGVKSSGGNIADQSEVEVVEVTGSAIFVRPLK